MKQKYGFTNMRVTLNENLTLTRIVALTDFGNIKSGTVGGYIQATGNLSQDGLCWVADSAYVFGLARITGDATVCGNAVVCDRACVTDRAIIRDRAILNDHTFAYGDVEIGASSFVSGATTVYGNARIFCESNGGRCRLPNVRGLARIMENAVLLDRGTVSERAVLRDHAVLRGNARLSGDAVATGHSLLDGSARVTDNAYVTGFAELSGRTLVCNHAAVFGRCKVSGRSIITGNAKLAGRGSYHGIRLGGNDVCGLTYLLRRVS